MLLSNNNYEVLENRYEKMSHKRLIAHKSFSISDLRIMYNDDTPELLMQAQLAYLNKAFNFNDERKLNDIQIRIIASNLVAKFSSYKLGEIWLFFKLVITGKLGTFYANLDPIVINQMADVYQGLRWQIINKDNELYILLRNREWSK